MTDALRQYEARQIETLLAGKQLPDFRAGDVVRVKVKISDGDGKTDRIQAFEGLCISIKNRGLSSAFTVRKMSHGEGVERTFPLYSPRIDGIDVVRRGVIRRAKLYYMRELTGKAARIKEKREGLVTNGSNDNSSTNSTASESSAS